MRVHSSSSAKLKSFDIKKRSVLNLGERPGFLTVTYSGSGLTTMNYEKKMIREKDVKFDGEDGSLELTDVRIVWIKKPSKWGGMGKFGGIAAAVGGAIAADIIGSSVGGVAGHAIRRAGRTVAYASIGVAVSSWTMDSYYNKDKNGNTETIALPLVAISQATQSGKKLIVELKSGGNMQFEFKQSKVIPSVIANVTSAQNEGKCPYCGTNAPNATSCPKCGAPIEGGSGAPAQGGGETIHVHIPTEGGSGFCTKCGQPLPAGSKFCGKCGQPV